MEFILEHAKSKAALEKDEVLRYAVERNLEVIGEAAKRIPESIRKQYRHIPWKEMTGMRDIIIHQYDGIDLDEVWGAIKKEMPRALRGIEKLLTEKA